MDEQASLKRERELNAELHRLTEAREGIKADTDDFTMFCAVCEKSFRASTEHLTVSWQKESLEHDGFSVRDAVELCSFCLDCAVRLRLNDTMSVWPEIIRTDEDFSIRFPLRQES